MYEIRLKADKTVIDSCATLKEAKQVLGVYEAIDKAENTYTKNKYEIYEYHTGRLIKD